MRFRAIILISGNLAKQKVPHNQHYPCTVLVGEEKWNILGPHGSFPRGQVYTRNIITRKRLAKPHMNQGRWRSSCESKLGSIIVVGGLTGTGRFTSSVEIFSGSNWKTSTPFPVKICCGNLFYNRIQDSLIYSGGFTGKIFTVL